MSNITINMQYSNQATRSPQGGGGFQNVTFLPFSNRAMLRVYFVILSLSRCDSKHSTNLGIATRCFTGTNLRHEELGGENENRVNHQCKIKTMAIHVHLQHFPWPTWPNNMELMLLPKSTRKTVEETWSIVVLEAPSKTTRAI